MDDCIYRNAFCRHLADVQFAEAPDDRMSEDEKKHHEGMWCGLQEATDAAKRFPAADVAPVVHGYWELYETFASVKIHRCSICKADAERNAADDEILSKYCPHCGAKMDGEKNG